MSELKEARRLKAKALLALGRKVEAIDLLYESSDADGLSELFRAANAAGWSPDVESKVLEAFKKHCTDISFSDGTSEPEDCEKAALALVTLKRVAVFAHIHAITREWLQPKEGSPPDDDGQKGRGLLLLARLSEAESTFLRAGETVQDHFTQAARLGAKEARDWLRARNLPIPQIAQAARNDSEKLGDEGRWNAVADKDADKKSLCRATSSHGILTMSVKKDRKPTLVVSAGAPGWGVGSVSYDADVEGIDPPSVRIFVGRDEFVSPVRVAAGRLEPTGDQAALIKRMATAAMVRFEYRVGARILVDVMSLEGFTAVYKTMVTQCADMTSALNVTPADAKSTGPSQSAAPKAPINPSPKATAKAAPQNPAAVAGAPIVLLQRQPNRYFKNDGYRKQSGSTFEQCSALCGGEPRCVAIEFQRANRTCQFYSTVEPSFAATGTDIAVKR